MMIPQNSYTRLRDVLCRVSTNVTLCWQEHRSQWPIDCSEYLMLRLVSSATLASTTADWPTCCIDSSTGSMFLSASSTNSTRPSTDVCRTRHRLTWSPRVHWSLISPADNTSTLPAQPSSADCSASPVHHTWPSGLLYCGPYGMECIAWRCPRSGAGMQHISTCPQDIFVLRVLVFRAR